MYNLLMTIWPPVGLRLFGYCWHLGVLAYIYNNFVY